MEIITEEIKPKKRGRVPKPDNAITCQAAADLFNISANSLTTMVRTGKIHCWTRGNIKYVSADEVREYRANNSDSKSLKRSAALYPVGDITKIDSNTPMERLLTIETQCYADYTAARESNKLDSIRAAQKAYSDISSTIAEASKRESFINDIKTEWWQECSETIRKWSEPIKSICDQLPKSLAQKCNPDNPSIAEKALTDWRDFQLYKMLSTKPKELK
jgi:hypothetical protein